MRDWIPAPRVVIAQVITALIVVAILAAWRTARPEQGPSFSLVVGLTVAFAAVVVVVDRGASALDKLTVEKRYRKALIDLSNSLGDFLLERKRTEPSLLRFGDRDKQLEEYDRHHKETVAVFSRQFHARFLAIYEELKRRGVRDEGLASTSFDHIVNTLQIEEIARRIAVLAERF